MADKGWIKLHRKITECGIWRDKPYDRAHAWVDILLMVNHEGKKFLHGNEMVYVERGSKLTSIRKLGERWGWSNNKVTAFLKLLQSENMLIQNSDTKKTVLTVVNYDIYQSSQDTEETPTEHVRDTDETRMHTNKNDKECKNEKKINISSKVFADDSPEIQLSYEFLTLIRINNSSFKEPNVQKWASEFDKIIRIDNRAEADIRSVMAWSQKDNFWKSNILSPGKLREKFDTLFMQMNSRGRSVDKPKPNRPKSYDAIDQWYEMTKGME